MQPEIETLEAIDQARHPFEPGGRQARNLRPARRKLVAVTLIIAVLVALIGMVAGKELLLITETSIALAVATVPEGLPIVATLALARGMWRMARREALINRLSAVETLGSSLLLIKPDDTYIVVEEGSRGLKKVRVRFSYNGEKYRLIVTDPLIENQYMTQDLGEYRIDADDIYLTVSISEPFEGFCYKLAAGIIY